MISEDLIDMLVDPDPEVRKRGVMQLGKSKDPDALPYLAEVYRDDDDAEVRELARKAGLFIRKNAPAGGGRSAAATAPAPRRSSAPESAYSDLYGSSDDLYANDNDDDDAYANADSSPLPSELKVSRVQEERAQGLMQQALDLNMRGDNQRATKALEKALHTNPKLMYDNYTISLASTITGMDGREAVRTLGPSSDELSKLRSSGTVRRSGTQILFAYSLIMSGVIILFSYFLLAWIDFSAVPTQDETGETITLGELQTRAQEQMDELGELAAQVPELQAFVDAFNGLKFEFNGLDTTLVSIGAQDVFEVMGFRQFMEATAGGLVPMEELELEYEPVPLDYTLILIPIAAGLAAVMGILLLMNGRISLWVFAIIIGILGIVPHAYFYTSAINEVVPDDATLASLGEMPAGTELIGIGFWVSLAGMLVVIVVPFLAMLTMPSKQNEF